MNQLGFPSEVTPQEIAREKSLGGAISLCAKAAGLEPKQVQDALKALRQAQEELAREKLKNQALVEALTGRAAA